MIPGLEATAPLVGILMGSESDRPVMEKACAELDERALSYEIRVISAHRNPKEVAAYAESASVRGIRVIICGAGMAAALPGVVAAYTELPVIGVPIASGGLGGMDALLAISQMPPGRAGRLHGDRRRAQRGDLRVAHPRAGRHADRVRGMSAFGTPEEAARAIALAGERGGGLPPRRATTCRPRGCSATRSARSTACRCRASGKGLEATIERVASEVLPRSHSHSHPRSFPFIDGSGLEAGIAAAVLAAALDANLGGGAGARLGGRGRGLALARRADRLPGRRRPLHERRHAREHDGPGVRPRDARFPTRASTAWHPARRPVYASEQAHNSIARACDLLGLGRRVAARRSAATTHSACAPTSSRARSRPIARPA